MLPNAMVKLLAGAVHSAAAAWACSQDDLQPSDDLSAAPTATLGIGTVIGIQTSLPSATAPVNKFLGIPFAQSPPKRFSPPEPVQSLNGTLLAQSWKASCMQQFLYPQSSQNFSKAIFNQPPPEESEDCLYLNIYTPSTAAPAGGRAVLFWIYGGSFAFGTAGIPWYDGSAFAAYQDIIVVSINYRTNIFGFPNTRDHLPQAEWNPGFLDQRMALQWVQDEIANFGGDPNKVTIAGESAGANSVDTLLTSYSNETAPFRAAILESGQVGARCGRSPTGTNDSVGNPWVNVTGTLNCTRVDSSDAQMACVRRAPAAALKNIVEVNRLTFRPIVDNTTYVSSPDNARATGQFARVPIMGGTNTQECRLFMVGQGSYNFTDYLYTRFGDSKPDIIPQLLEALPVGNTSLYDTDFDRQTQVETLLTQQCPMRKLTTTTASLDIPAWRYLYNASFPNQAIFTASGVYHSIEIAIVFETYPGGPISPLTSEKTGLQPTNVSATAQEAALSMYINAAWANFVKNPLLGPGWNAQGTFDGLDIGLLGTNGTSGVTVVGKDDVDSLCDLLLV